MTSPDAFVLQSTGRHVPPAPAFWPVTLKLTSVLLSAVPEWVTCAVTVCVEPVATVAVSGLSAMLSEDTTTAAPR